LEPEPDPPLVLPPLLELELPVVGWELVESGLGEDCG